MGPLSGVRILDLTSVLMGPYATLQLGDMGAEIIKVETPEGDIVRQIGPSRTPGMGGMFLHTNRSKRSIVIDLKRAEGREALLRLARSADVLVFNMRPKALARLGLGYETFKAIQPKIIFVGLVGFGQGGRYAARPAYDDLIQGASCVASLLAETSEGTPRYVPVNIADRIVGLFAAQAILGALFHRQRTGEGQAIEVPMFESMVSLVLGDHFQGLTYRPPLDQGGYPRLMSPNRRPYATSDGHICALIYTDKHWKSFFEALDTPDALTDWRFASLASRLRNIDSIYQDVARIFRTRTTEEWCALLDRADIPHMPMHTLATIQDDAHLKDVGFFEPADHPIEGPTLSMRVASRWSVTQPEPTRPAPALGEHSHEILAEAGFTDDEIEQLLSTGVVKQYSAATSKEPQDHQEESRL